MIEKNKSILESILPALEQDGIMNIINGKSMGAQSGDTFDNHSPVDNKFIARVAKSDASDIDVASKAAAKAFTSWKNLPHKERRDILYSIADIIE
ncbi:MAG: aldehyde dehydrogenase family protein, partial [Saprospiraceae bacterium]|nr:aldehyde dehydrogenase family protein [Saprospiraceae bacterium]